MRSCAYCGTEVLFQEGIGWRTPTWGVTCPKSPTYDHRPGGEGD